MMSTLQVPKMSVPGVYIKRGNSMSSLESVGSSDVTSKPSRQLLNGKANGGNSGSKSNGLVVYLDNIAFELGDESTTDSVPEETNTTSNIGNAPPGRTDIDKDNEKECDSLPTAVPKNEISFTMSGEKMNNSLVVDDRLRKTSDTSIRSDSPLGSGRRRKSVQIVDVPQVKQEPPKENKCKKFQLHIMVLLTFIFIVVSLGLVWHFHKEERLAIEMDQRVTFDAASRVLTFKNVPWSPEKFIGHMAKRVPKGWLPIDCTTNKKQSSSICMRWKGAARVFIDHYTVESLNCFGVRWISDHAGQHLSDCFISNAHWFGPSNSGHFQWPLVNFSYTYSPNFTYNDVSGTFGYLSEHVWLSSNGIAIIVNESTAFRVTWQNLKSMNVCVESASITNSASGFSSPDLNQLSYSVCYNNDIMSTYRVVKRKFLRNTTRKFPNRKMFEHPHWVVQMDNDDELTSDSVTNMAEELGRYNFTCSTLELNGKWEKEYGDLEFNMTKFTNISGMIETVKKQNCDLLLPFSPYTHHDSENFAAGIDFGFFIMDAGGRAPGLTIWKHGVVAVLDVSNKNAEKWLKEKLYLLQSTYNISSFRFTYDGNATLPFQPHLTSNFTSGELMRRFVEITTEISDNVIASRVTHSQNASVFVSVEGSVVQKDTDMCITNLVEKALLLGILGYPYIISDGLSSVGKTEDSKTELNEKLYLRWLQVSIFFPALRFSVFPWTYNEDVLSNVRHLLAIRNSTVIPTIFKMREQILQGVPIIRPLWWSYPTDLNAMNVSDQFLLGDNLLIAPILCRDQTLRDIYIPAGIWKDINEEKAVSGPKWLTNYGMTLSDAPCFIKMQEHDNGR